MQPPDRESGAPQPLVSPKDVARIFVAAAKAFTREASEPGKRSSHIFSNLRGTNNALKEIETDSAWARGEIMTALNFTFAEPLRPKTEKIPMKMMFFSSDWTEVEIVRKEFVDANIPCEVRIDGVVDGMPPNAIDAQLWIHNEQHAYKALLLCVELGIGFGKPGISSERLAA